MNDSQNFVGTFHLAPFFRIHTRENRHQYRRFMYRRRSWATIPRPRGCVLGHETETIWTIRDDEWQKTRSGLPYSLSPPNDTSNLTAQGFQASSEGLSFMYQLRGVTTEEAMTEVVARRTSQRSPETSPGSTSFCRDRAASSHPTEEVLTSSALYEDEERTPITTLPGSLDKERRAVARPVTFSTAVVPYHGARASRIIKSIDGDHIGSIGSSHPTEEVLTSSALNEDEERSPITILPESLDKERRAVARPVAFSTAVVPHHGSRAPHIVKSINGDKVRPMVLYPLPLSLQPKRPANIINPWKSKVDVSPVTMPFPSAFLLPSLVDDQDDGDDDGDEDEEPEIVSVFCKPASTGNGRILRVVSQDDDEDANDGLRASRHIENLGDGGDIELMEIVSSKEDTKSKTLNGRKAAPPRRLDYALAFRSERPMTIWDALPASTKALPTTGSDYASVIGSVLASDESGHGAQKADFILRFMLEEYKSGRGRVRPDGGMYNKVMHGYATRGTPEKVEELLRVMCKEYESGDELAAPNARHYTTLLHAWQNAKVPYGPDRAESILSEMHKMYETDALPCKPDAHAYTAVLHCWSKSLRPDAGDRAEALFREMKHRFEQGDVSLRPDALLYSNLINAVSNGGGLAHAEDLLWEMVDEYLKGNELCEPRIRHLNTILAVWSRSHAPYAPERAEELLRRWLCLNDEGVLEVEPDNWTYSLVLKCWSISSRNDVAERTWKLVKWMQDLAKKGSKGARLDDVKIGTCMTAWVGARGFSHAADFLESFCHEALAGHNPYIPDIQHFQKTINGLCGVQKTARADELVRLLWKVITTSKIGMFRGKTHLLARVVIKQWTAIQRPDRAESLLLEMAGHYRRGKLPEYPDGECYWLAIEAWKASKFHDRASHVKDLMDDQASLKAYAFANKPRWNRGNNRNGSSSR